MKKYGLKHVLSKTFSQRNPGNKIIKNNESQLLLIGGVLITIIILSMTMISISIPDITKPVYKKDFIKYEYANIREEFGVLLNDNLEGVIDHISDSDTFDEFGMLHFEETKQMFSYLEKSHGNYFNAEYVDFSSGPPKKVEIKLTLKNEKETITEIVEYELS